MARTKMIDQPSTVALLVQFAEGAGAYEIRGLPDTPERRALKAAGLIESYRSRHWRASRPYWRITDAGRARYLELKGVK